MTTNTNKKKTSRLALATLYISVCVFLLGYVYLLAYDEHWDSLLTNKRVGALKNYSLMAWFLLSVITFFSFLSSVSRIVWSKKKIKGIGISFTAIIILAVTAAIVMPSVEVATYIKCQRIANSYAYKKFSQSNKSHVFSLKEYNIELSRYTIPQDKPRIFEVHYILKEKVDSWPYPQEFSVLLNFDTGEKSIIEETALEE